ncbi:peptidase M23 [Micromonospora sp. NBC_01655]|uniref:peptidase M23 n=1 Tax=Micromonospora sp. NBC_01655 TaxID=2975983 RepID=UPI00225A6093|nr:peptidase M23 [Micromonospora sp. NBC_01655]MCX4473334.1 peptidase M23 [Micromonospora sp. NBC_01655]
MTTRSGRWRNLLAPGRSASGPAAPGGPERRPGRAAVALAAGVTCCLGLAALAQACQGTADTADRAAAIAGADLERRAAAEAASRSLDRMSTPSASVSPSAPAPSASASTADPDTTRAPAPRKRPVRPADPAPVAGLTKAQMANAKVIVRTGRAMGVPRRGLVIAVATAMQESNLYNVASGVLPESQEYPHQGIGWDHDSVGLFQQRASSGWGEVGQLMDPAFATRQFLTALQQVPGWRDLPLTVAAQAVQISAYPDLYAQHEWRAAEVVDAHLTAGK